MPRLSHAHFPGCQRAAQHMITGRRADLALRVPYSLLFLCLSIRPPPFSTDQSSAASLGDTAELTPRSHLSRSRNWQLSHRVRSLWLDNNLRGQTGGCRSRGPEWGWKSFTKLSWPRVRAANPPDRSQSSRTLLFRARGAGSCQVERRILRELTCLIVRLWRNNLLSSRVENVST